MKKIGHADAVAPGIRNVAAFHVDEAVIDRGLNELAKDRVVDLAEGQGAKNIDSVFSLGTLALFHGLEMNLDDYGAFVRMVTSDHVVAAEAIQIASSTRQKPPASCTSEVQQNPQLT